MPLPSPRKSENEDQWIQRCMGDENMVSEFPDRSQRRAVCGEKWKSNKSNQSSRCVNFKVQFSAGDFRYEQFEGRQHLVAPVIFLVEGVHNGSGGAYYYPQESIANTIHLWNNRPVPVFHPEIGGIPVSCNSPEIIEANNVGTVFNARIEDGKAKGEVWIDIQKANRVYPQLISMILSGQPLEVSTGLYSRDEQINGVWNEEEYVGVIRDIDPDHLAILPGQTGACSWEDGCGIRSNEQSENERKGGENLNKVKSAEEAKAIGEEIVSNLDDEEKRSWVSRKLVGLASWLGFTVTDNQSHEDIRREVQQFVDSLDVPTSPSPGVYHFVRDVYDNYFVYEARRDGDGTVLFKQGYSVKDGKVEIQGDPEEVVEERTYVKAQKDDKQNSKEVTDNMAEKERKQQVDALIANEHSTFEEKDREWLAGLDDKSFENVAAISKKAEERIKNASSKEEPEPEPKEDPKPAANADPGEPTVEDYLKKAPAGIREVLNQGMAMVTNKKAELIETITNAEGNKFTKEELDGMEVSALERIASLIPQVQADYSGRGGVVRNESAPKRNERHEDGTGVPDPPVIEFDKK